MDMKKSLSFSLLIILLLSPTFADYIQQTSDSGYAVTGQMLVKIDANGNLQWNKSFGGQSVQQTFDGGYVVANAASLTKTDANGNEQWSKTFDKVTRFTGSRFTGYTVKQTVDGGYVLWGTETIAYRYALLVKVDAGGNKQWDKDFGNPGQYGMHATDVQQASDGGYISTGYVTPGFDYRIIIIKTDSDGNEKWRKIPVLREGMVEEAYSIKQTSDGGYVLAGKMRPSSGGKLDALLVKVDADGTVQWNKTFGGAMWDMAYSAQQTSDGGYVFTGYTRSSGKGGEDYWLVKADSKGDMEWSKTFGGKDEDIAYSVQQTVDGGYILAGEAKSVGSGTWLVKTDADGNEQWNRLLGEAYIKAAPPQEKPSDTPSLTVSDQVNGSGGQNRTSGGNADASMATDTVQEATKKGDVSICNKIEIFSLRDGCIMSVAIAKGDIKLCDTMSADTKQMTGQDKMCKAAVSHDAKYCDEITTYMGVGQDEVRNACRMWGKNTNATAPAGTPTSILTQLKNKLVSMFFGGTDEKTKPECASEKDCGDGVCDNGNCVESKMTFVFVPVNWKGSMGDFDKKVDERVNLLLNTIPLKDCKNAMKTIKSHENCKVLFAPTGLSFFPDSTKVKLCARRVTTNYNYIVGLTDSEKEIYGVSGATIVGYNTAIITTEEVYPTVHEIGHMFGLKDEYCNAASLTSPLKTLLGSCGFNVKPNSLKSEEGCRKEDSPYDKDDFPDCCISNEYEDACSGNVGISDSKVANDIYANGVYDKIDGIIGDVNYIWENMFKCDDDFVKDRVKISLVRLVGDIDKYYGMQKEIGFKLGNAEPNMQKIKESQGCLEKNDYCSCLIQYADSYKLPKKSRFFLDNFISFNSRNMMVRDFGKKDGPLEFSKPAYDYLSTLPEMQCGDSPAMSSTPTSNATISQPAAGKV